MRFLSVTVSLRFGSKCLLSVSLLSGSAKSLAESYPSTSRNRSVWTIDLQSNRRRCPHREFSCARKKPNWNFKLWTRKSVQNQEPKLSVEYTDLEASACICCRGIWSLFQVGGKTGVGCSFLALAGQRSCSGRMLQCPCNINRKPLHHSQCSEPCSQQHKVVFLWFTSASWLISLSQGICSPPQGHKLLSRLK